MPLLALDDTDTVGGGCTTHTAFEVAAALSQRGGPLAGWGLLGPPRLVRLDPAIPWKTRGNGALVLPIGRIQASPSIHIGRGADGRPISVPIVPPMQVGFTRAEADALASVVEAVLPAPGTGDADPQPAAVLLPSPPSPRLYEAAVARPVAPHEAWACAPPGSMTLTPPGRRGEVGALAAAAWPAARSTWEVIGYRSRDERGPERRLPVDFGRVHGIAGGFDHGAPDGRLRCVPRTPCPVRFGVRGTDPEALLRTADAWFADADGAGGWLLLTNQATGDHARHAASAPAPHSVARLPVTVVGAPSWRRGGHLFVQAQNGKAPPVTLAAFEPTGGLRHALANAVAGDALMVLGRCGADAGTVAVEAFRVEALARRVAAGPNPRCPSCGRTTKSRGRQAPFRCPGCHVSVPRAVRATTSVRPRILTEGGVWQVDDAVRGHLLPPRAGLPAALGLDRRAMAAPVVPVLVEPALQVLAGAVPA